MKFPIIKCLLFFIIGILLNININFNVFFYFLIISLVSLALLEFGLRNNKNYKSNILEFLIAISLVISGITIVNLKDSTAYKNYVGNNPKLINQEHEFEVSIIKPISVKNKKITLKGNLKSYENEGYRSLIVGKILIHLKSDSNSLKLLPGDVINFSSKLIELSSSGNPHQFNYAKYLKSKQIKYHTFVNSNWRLIKSSYSLLRFSTIVKNKCLHIFKNSGLKSDELAIASALTFGYKNELSNNIKGIFSKTGSMHVLAVSGLHVGIIYLIISFLFKPIKLSYNYSWVKEIITLLIIWIYAIITGLSPSVLRAATMMSFFVIANVLKKNSSIYNVISCSAFFMLLINPFLIIDVGFQLSYLAVIGIVYIYPIIFNLLSFKNYLLIKLWTLISVSIAAQIATFPISIFYFHQFPNLFLISNIIVIPLVFVLLVLGLLVLILNFNIYFSIVVAKFYSFLLSILIQILSFLENISYSVTKGLFISGYETILLNGFIFLIFLYLEFKTLFLLRLSLIVVILLISIDLTEDFLLLKQKKIIVYNISNHVALDLIEGSNHYFIADENLINNNDKLKFHVENNWNFNDLNTPEIIPLKDFISKTIIWQNLAIAFVDNNWTDYPDVNISLVVGKPKSLKTFYSNSSIKVIQKGRSFIKNEIINQKLIKNKNTFHDVFNRGSYIYDLQ